MALLVPSGTVFAQEVSESVKRTCRSVADSTARSIVSAIRAKREPADAVRRVPDSWLEGVQAHMLLAASKASSLSEDDLAAIGYSYCVERRPTTR
ncbi:hypothetical protein BWI17_05325 [Betaproteobacteria bacterium GR16-43]|nr:hypothetical protein BWI17_05325 [Betaproteobacteria bacterium GR16-43]